MAYLQSIRRSCTTCGKPATVRLVNWQNAPMASYCDKCGKVALQRQQASEDAMPRVPSP